MTPLKKKLVVAAFTLLIGMTIFTHIGLVNASNGESHSSTNGSTSSAVAITTCSNLVTVTTTADSGAGSLRDAITNVCASGTIIFDPTLTSSGPATISLLTALPNISTGMTISGPGANLLKVERSTTQGTQRFSIFVIAPGKTATISGLTISNGAAPGLEGYFSGGGIRNDHGTLTISECTVSGNSVLSNLGSSRGGGISNEGWGDGSDRVATLTVINSTISGNSADIGGGINSTGDGGGYAVLEIINSTISGNNANVGSGGGIYSMQGTGYSAVVAVTGSTITGNRSSGAGGGIFIQSPYHGTNSVTLNNTIVAGNFNGASPSTIADDIAGKVETASSFNLIGTGGSGGLSNGTNNNQVGVADPGLAPLAFYGGPTQTHLLLPSSPAINKGSNALANDQNNNALTTDQRRDNYPRIINTTVDIGAVEVGDINYAIYATAGTLQSITLGKTFTAQLKAVITESGATKSGVPVTFAAPLAGASGAFEGGNTTVTVMTDSNGIATAPAFTANSVAGSYKVTASLNGDSPSATFRLTNLKNQAQVSFSNLTQTYDGNPKSVAVLTVPAGLSVTITYDGAEIAPTNARVGGYAVTATINDANYQGATTGTLIINKADSMTTVAAINAVFDGSLYGGTAKVTGAGGLDQSLSVIYTGRNATVYGPSTTAPSNAGDYTASASFGGDANHQGSSGSKDFQIVKANQAISFNALADTTYGTGDFTVSASASSGLSVSLVASGQCTISSSRVHITGAGACTITASQAGNVNYNAAASVPQTFTISKANATITLSNLAQTYTGFSKVPTVITTPSGLGTTNTYSQNGSPVAAAVNAGAYNVTVTINNTNYQGSATDVLVINKATPTIFWNNPANIVVGTALSNAQLNAISNVPGTFQYNPPAGTVLGLGTAQLSVTFTPTDAANYNGSTKSVSLTVTPPPPPAFTFSSASYGVNESAGNLPILVMRTGDAAPAVSVDYATTDNAGLTSCNTFNGVASSRCDYANTLGTLRFAAGETTKTIFIPIVNDSYAEGVERFSVRLSNPSTGASLGTSPVATVTIADNETVTGSLNPITDPQFFIRQQYIDFLGREPDPAGWQGWQDILKNCQPTDQTCDRVAVSSGFFRSPEFQDRGYFIYRFYPVALGRAPHYSEFIPDMAKVSGFLSEEEKEANKVAFVNEFMARPEFSNRYGPATDPTIFVDGLLQTCGLPNHSSRDTWIAQLTNGTATRAQVLRALTESKEVYDKFYNESFVVMQYFGYLRRDPDILYLEWIKTMNSNGGDYRAMINGFMGSSEYFLRFGP